MASSAIKEGSGFVTAELVQSWSERDLNFDRQT